MKCFIVLLALVALVTADHSSEEEDWIPKTGAQIKAIRGECLSEIELSEEQINKMKQFEFPDEEPVRKYLLCTALKLRIFCTKAGYHPERLAQQFKMDLDDAEALEIAKSCSDKNEQGSPNDVWAFRGHQCIMKSKIGEKVKAYVKKKYEEAAAKEA